MTAPAQIAADTTPAPPSDPSAQRPGRTASRPWQRWALGVILVVSAALYGWDLWNAGWGNEFYTAAVKSMSKDFTNFLFGSFDPAGVVTVDKPPMGLWPQVVSVWVFGFHQWSVALPQALEGVAAVFLLHRTVRRWWGENVALLAAALLALTPITVAIDHVNNPDAALVLWSVAAAYALTRAVADGIAPRSRTKWLLLCAFLLGCAFVTKMLAGWIVVPGFAVAFLLAGGSSWKRRIGDLAGATGVLLVGSFWWPLLHDFWPGAPYMDNSTDGTAMNLIFAYNGLNRIVGNDTPGGVARGGGAGGTGGFGGGAGFSTEAEAQIERFLQARGGGGGGGFGGLFGGGTGLGRMFSASVGGQISWLIPFSLFVLAIVVVVGVLRMRHKLPGQPALRAGWMMWGSWLIVTGVVFSYAQGIWHSYYTTMLAPPIAAIAAAGLAVLWRYYRDSRGLSWLLLPLGVALTAVWAFVLVERVPTWNGWAGPAVLAVAAVAVLVLVLTKLVRVTAGSARPAQFGLALAGVALVLVPAVWSSATAFAGERAGGAMASAGPTTTGGFGGGATTGGRGGTGGTKGGGRGGTGRGTGNATRNAAFGGSDQALTADEQKILAYVVRTAPNARIKLAIEGTSNQAAPWIINSDQTVIGMGGFMGSDNAPSVAQLTDWVATGQLKYVLGTTTTGAGRGGAGGFGGAAAGGRGGSYATARSAWISKNCTAVPASAYGGTATSANTGGGGAFFGGGGGGAQTLYLCTAK